MASLYKVDSGFALQFFLVGTRYIIVYNTTVYLFGIYSRMRVITRVEFKAGKVWILFVARKKVYFSILYKHTNRRVAMRWLEKRRVSMSIYYRLDKLV